MNAQDKAQQINDAMTAYRAACVARDEADTLLNQRLRELKDLVEGVDNDPLAKAVKAAEHLIDSHWEPSY